MPEALHAAPHKPPASAPDAAPARGDAHARHMGRLALQALFREVALPLKPGLVGPQDTGSHQDMDFTTFMRSLQALRSYFPAITACGARGPAFPALQALGVEAEARMLAATGGINTHRGAIFNLGLLCAAAGRLHARGIPASALRLSASVRHHWGPAILASAGQTPDSHGSRVSQRHGCGGARAEAAAGFPAALEIGLPAYRQALAATGQPDAAATQALFALIARLDDTNLLWRGGTAGLSWAQDCAQAFLAAGGVRAPDWQAHAAHIHADFVARRLSPGGSADLLGVTLFLEAVEHASGPAV